MLLPQSKKRVSQESKTFGRLWEMQIKAVLWDHLSLLITESIMKTTKSVKDVREKEPSVTAYRKVSLKSHYGSQWGASSNPTEIHTKDSKSTYHRDFCTSMIIAVLLTITKLGTSLHIVNTYVNTSWLWYTCTVEFYFIFIALKKR